MALVLGVNSYTTSEVADRYFETRIDAANWFEANQELKDSALVTATSIVDNQEWIGSAVSSTQPLAWPRNNATYYDTRMGCWITIPNDVVPDQVYEAVFEQSLHLLDNEDVLQGKIQTFESITVGQISLSDSNGDVQSIPMQSTLVKKKLKPLIKGNSGAVGSIWWRAN
jgi:hypothetical protein